MDDRTIHRCHYRGRLNALEDAQLLPLLRECEEQARALIANGELMTCALYYHGRQLFLYYEAIGECMPPERFMGPLHPALTPFPQKEEDADWAKMYHIYWHCVPQGERDWVRPVPPQRRRGRIAYLKHDAMFSYVYHHHAIVQEGKLMGDRYQSIALHEDVLFSYFEEPRTHVNILRDPTQESEAINAWMAADPESHFIPLPGSNGANFLLLPEYFALGRI